MEHCETTVEYLDNILEHRIHTEHCDNTVEHSDTTVEHSLTVVEQCDTQSKNCDISVEQGDIVVHCDSAVEPVTPQWSTLTPQ